MLLTTKRVKLIEKKRFVIVALDPNYKTFIIYITTLNINFASGTEIYISKKAQIAHLKIDKAFIEVQSKYANLQTFFLQSLL